MWGAAEPFYPNLKENKMKLNHAKIIVNEPRYLEAQKVIAEAEAAEAAALEAAKVVKVEPIVPEPVEPIE